MSSPARVMPATIGRYQILCSLGEGGMGAVYLGRVVGPGGFERLVALKVLHEHLARRPGFVDMFMDEARIAARIRHTNVVAVLETGADGERYFIAMEYVSGETLARALNRLARHNRRLPIPLAAHIVWATSEGLHAAHELVDSSGKVLGVVHRDVSPENIIVGYDGSVRITDFGIAKASDQSSYTMPGTWKGKAGYLSPEQILGQPVDRRADVFGLGIVLWEATLGSPLFSRPNAYESVEKIRNVDVPLPRVLDAKYPKQLEAIVMKALAKQPEDRYATARDFGQDLRKYASTLEPHVSSVEVEEFMSTVFTDRLKQRRELERRAAVVRAPMLDPDSVPAPAKNGSEETARPQWTQPMQRIEPDELVAFDSFSSPLESASSEAAFGAAHGEDRPSEDEVASQRPARAPPVAGLENDPLLSAMTDPDPVHGDAGRTSREARAFGDARLSDRSHPADEPKKMKRSAATDKPAAPRVLLWVVVLAVLVACGWYLISKTKNRMEPGASSPEKQNYQRFEAERKR